MIIGIIGSLLILLAWVPETYRTIKTKNAEAIDIKFLILYLLGSFILVIYSIQINDIPFTILNSLISFISLIEMVLLLKKKIRQKS
ncbi:MAG: SemiSWEET family transporter [Candidatus Aenigmatarchaeota archaeon]